MSGVQMKVMKVHPVVFWQHDEISSAQSTACGLCYKDVVEENSSGTVECHTTCRTLFHSDCSQKFREHFPDEEHKGNKCPVCGNAFESMKLLDLYRAVPR